MTPEAHKTARELAADPRWKWHDGILALWPDGTLWGRYDALDEDTQEDFAGFVPDLDDPATGGVILAMLIAAESGGIEVWIPRRSAYSDGVRVDGEDGDTLGHAAGLAWLATGGSD